MKTKRTKREAKLMLKLRSYGSYIDEACQLERILGKKPRRLQIDLAGSGEIPPDSALLIRSILLARSPRTHITMNARSSLQGAAVLVWLMGDKRLIRDDAKLFFRAAGPFEASENGRPVWRDRSFFEPDEVEEADYLRVLQAINEFLPVKELAGKPVELPVLKQFGLVDNENVDRFLAAAFRLEKPEEKQASSVKKPSSKKNVSI